MVDQSGRGRGAEAAAVSDAFASAHALLRTAEEDAAQLRADADRYVRQRESEAELLVAKARRLLAVAEEKAAAIIATARIEAPHLLEASVAMGVGAPPAASDAEGPATEVAAAAGRLSAPSGLDDILASAISRAVDRSFPADP
jgi:hypothetical protein